MAEIIKFTTPVFRLSFPHLFVPQQPKSGSKGEPKYGLSAVWTPAKFTENEKALWKKILAALDAESKSRFKKPWKDLPANVKRGLRDGDEKSEMEGYGEGTKFASVTSRMKPGVIDINKGEDGKFLPIGPEHGNEELIYPGCFCRATVTVYSYDNEGKGVALGLMNVQRIKDGPRLDSRTDAAEDFGDDVDESWLEETEDDDPLG
jgi:hypothetical protein